MSGHILKTLTYGTKLPYIPEKHDAAIWIASLLETVARNPYMKDAIVSRLCPPEAVDGIVADLDRTTVYSEPSNVHPVCSLLIDTIFCSTQVRIIQDHTNERYFCLEWSWWITHVGGVQVTKKHVSKPKKHPMCINDLYLQQAINVIQAQAQGIHEALLATRSRANPPTYGTISDVPSDIDEHTVELATSISTIQSQKHT
jgi:hypothetical protein